MRIVAGTLRGRRIDAPRGERTRPTSDRAREAIFNLLGPVEDAVVLDLFAGSGAMGLEALSRGAARCLFVESDRAACAVIGCNVERLGIETAEIRCGDAVAALRHEARERRSYDLVIADPPYESYDLIEGSIAKLVPGVLAANGLLVVETNARIEPELPLEQVVSRKYGAARITLFAP